MPSTARSRPRGRDRRRRCRPPAAPMRSAPDETALFCIGAHMSGLPLNAQFAGLGGRFLRVARTAPAYRLYALGNRAGPAARRRRRGDRRRGLGAADRRDRRAAGAGAAAARLRHVALAEGRASASWPKRPASPGARTSPASAAGAPGWRRREHDRHGAGCRDARRPDRRRHRAARPSGRAGLARRDPGASGGDACAMPPWSALSRCRTRPNPRRCSAACIASAGRAAVEAALARIARAQPGAERLHRRHRRPRPRARRCARRRAAPAGRPAPLAGVPFAVKNLIDVAGPADLRRVADQPRPPAGDRGRDAGAPAGSGRRGAGRRAEHGRIRLRLHRRERHDGAVAQPARLRRA